MEGLDDLLMRLFVQRVEDDGDDAQYTAEKRQEGRQAVDAPQYNLRLFRIGLVAYQGQRGGDENRGDGGSEFCQEGLAAEYGSFIAFACLQLTVFDGVGYHCGLDDLWACHAQGTDAVEEKQHSEMIPSTEEETQAPRCIYTIVDDAGFLFTKFGTQIGYSCYPDENERNVDACKQGVEQFIVQIVLCIIDQHREFPCLPDAGEQSAENDQEQRFVGKEYPRNLGKPRPLGGIAVHPLLDEQEG